MNGVWGSFISVNIFGQSHGKAIGVVINNLPAGIRLDLEKIQYELNRRRPHLLDDVAGNQLKTTSSTARKESDQFEIYSGYFEDRTTGDPLMALIKNSDVKSTDYESIKNILRPGHSDWSAYEKHKQFRDYRGGGHFSGRLTAMLVFACAIAKQRV